MHLSPARDNGRAHADRRDQKRITAIDRERVDHCDRFRWPCGGALSFARNGKTFRFPAAAVPELESGHCGPWPEAHTRSDSPIARRVDARHEHRAKQGREARMPADQDLDRRPEHGGHGQGQPQPVSRRRSQPCTPGKVSDRRQCAFIFVRLHAYFVSERRHLKHHANPHPLGTRPDHPGQTPKTRADPSRTRPQDWGRTAVARGLRTRQIACRSRLGPPRAISAGISR